jgi:hypothetical protein
MRSVETVVLLVALATVVAAFASRLSVPAPSLLVLVGVGVGMLPGAPAVHVPPELISFVVLPRCCTGRANSLRGATCGPCGVPSRFWRSAS